MLREGEERNEFLGRMMVRWRREGVLGLGCANLLDVVDGRKRVSGVGVRRSGLGLDGWVVSRRWRGGTIDVRNIQYQIRA
jgi:hypothetical protein